MKYPTGKGMFIWVLSSCANGDPVKLADKAIGARLEWVTIKISDGIAKYNVDLIGEAVRELKHAGVKVWGWFYTYGKDYYGNNQARHEAEVAVEVAQEYDLEGLFLDVEHEYKTTGAAARAITLMDTLKSLTDLPLGLCSYRYPSLHRELPWNEFLSKCDFHAPQVYWEQAHNPAYQLTRSVAELRELKNLPIIPIGSAYSRGGPWVIGYWAATSEDLNIFSDTAKMINLPGISYWSWQHAESLNGLWATIAAQDWGNIPEPEPPEPPDEEPPHEIFLPYIARVNAPAGLFTRATPEIANNKRGALFHNTEVTVVEEYGAWRKCRAEYWSHGSYLIPA